MNWAEFSAIVTLVMCIGGVIAWVEKKNSDRHIEHEVEIERLQNETALMIEKERQRINDHDVRLGKGDSELASIKTTLNEVRTDVKTLLGRH